MSAVSGTIFHIQRFSIHDGPGIRTTVFFKGCPLRCFWCHNPEGLHKAVEIQFEAERCIGCGECARVCPEGAQEIDSTGQRMYHRQRCVVCGACVSQCFSGGLQVDGQKISAKQVIDEILVDREFYMSTGGGVTLSGGEPMLQADFALGILQGCKTAGIHTALETTTHCNWETLASVLPFVDLLMIDIKHIDPVKHRAATGVSNERILANIRRLASTGKAIIFRTPVIPGVNDTVEEIGAIAVLIKEMANLPVNGKPGDTDRLSYELLAFHKLGADKYHSLGLEYPAERLEAPSREKMMALVEAAANTISVKSR